MAAMSSAMTRYRIQHLHGAGLPAPQIRDREQVSLRTVERVIAEPAIADGAAHERKMKLGMGRPRATVAFESRIREYLQIEPGLHTQAIVQRLREEGYRGATYVLYTNRIAEGS
jgi:transposase